METNIKLLIVAAFFIFFTLPLASKASEDMVFIKSSCFEMGDIWGWIPG